MGIWIVEKNNESSLGILQMISGSFPARCVATIKSLESLLRMRFVPRPQVIILNANQCLNEIVGNLHFSRRPHPEIIFLTTPKEQQKILQMLATGADQVNKSLFFLPNTIDSYNLCKYVANNLEKKTKENHYKELKLDSQKLTLMNTNESLKEFLTFKEAKILSLFLEAENKIVDKQSIRLFVWPDCKVSERTIDTHVCRLRKKLSSFHIQIESIYGKGYELI